MRARPAVLQVHFELVVVLGAAVLACSVVARRYRIAPPPGPLPAGPGGGPVTAGGRRAALPGW